MNHEITDKQPRVILASESTYKRELLTRTGVVFESIASAYEEDMTLPLSPEELAITLALGKARDVAEKNLDSIIIGTDCFVVFEGRVIGKPKDEYEARTTLRNYRGKTVDVLTGLAIIKGKEERTAIVSGQVGFRTDITDEEIEAYIRTGEPFRCAGAFNQDNLGAPLIRYQTGDYSAIVGIPICKTLEFLRGFGVNPLTR